VQAVFGLEREQHDELFYKECKNDSGPFHFHSQIEICFVLDGKTKVTIDGKQKILKKGDLSIALSYDAHHYEPIGYSETAVLIIPLHMCKVFTDSVGHQKTTTPFISNPELSKELKKYFDKIKKGSDNKITAHGYINVILGLIFDNIHLEFSDTADYKDLPSKVLNYIHSNFTNDISLKDLSTMIGCNQSYLSRCFNTHFNIGIKKYITLPRLKNALNLMSHGNSITYCAYESGFNSLRTFYSDFSKEFHCTPKEYTNKL